jgi:hypothetical protein
MSKVTRDDLANLINRALRLQEKSLELYGELSDKFEELEPNGYNRVPDSPDTPVHDRVLEIVSSSDKGVTFVDLVTEIPAPLAVFEACEHLVASGLVLKLGELPPRFFRPAGTIDAGALQSDYKSVHVGDSRKLLDAARRLWSEYPWTQKDVMRLTGATTTGKVDSRRQTLEGEGLVKLERGRYFLPPAGQRRPLEIPGREKLGKRTRLKKGRHLDRGEVFDVKRARELLEKGHTQTEVADHLGVSVSKLLRYLRLRSR